MKRNTEFYFCQLFTMYILCYRISRPQFSVVFNSHASYSRGDLAEKSFILGLVPYSKTEPWLTCVQVLTSKCSYFQPCDINNPTPALVHLDGNGCCRVEVMMVLLQYLLPYGISMFALDFLIMNNPAVSILYPSRCSWEV